MYVILTHDGYNNDLKTYLTGEGASLWVWDVNWRCWKTRGALDATQLANAKTAASNNRFILLEADRVVDERP